jgi:site-specific DNA-methyltransferase (adenine-specific)
MACAIEDAGFEIRDQLQWIFGSGFPKSLNIGKAVDELQGNERTEIGEGKWNPRKKHGSKGKNSVGLTTKQDFKETKGNSPYEGQGTALKPAHESICLARKPISEKTIAENVLKWGTGALNIDACRIGFKSMKDFNSAKFGRGTDITGGRFIGGDKTDGRTDIEANPAGRFPANIILDEEAAALLDEQAPGTGAFSQKDDDGRTFHDGKREGASRFFYCAKASRNERNRGLEGFEFKRYSDRVKDDGSGGDNPRNRTNDPRLNYHPTVKPVSLMRYLVRLVTPPGGTVLDPFNGSGTTGIACKLEAKNYIGIERESDFCTISRARIDGWEREKDENIAENTQMSLWQQNDNT